MGLPVVTIVGRPNVGKSSLLNCLARRRISIVDSMAGVTRDRVSAVIELGGGYVEVIDTGGYGIVDRDHLTEHVEAQIVQALNLAALVLFVVDIRDGMTPLDVEVAKLLRRGNKDVLLVANKADAASHEQEAGEFQRLGFGHALCVSALHAQGKRELMELIAEKLGSPGGEQPAEPAMKIAMIGRRNVGKSTLVNALAEAPRTIVSEIAGTTRDAVDVEFERNGKKFMAIDTAGVRKRTKMSDSVEFYSLSRALLSIQRCDVVMFMIDSTVPIGRIDKKLAGRVSEECKPCVLVINKWDLAKGSANTDDYGEYLTRTLPEVDYAPIAFMTAKDDRNVQSAVDLCAQLHKQACTRVGTGALNQAFEEIRELRGPSVRRGKRPPRMYYATQVAVSPPTIMISVNNPGLFREEYRRFLLNRLRELLPYPEVPIRLVLRARSSGKKGREAPSSTPNQGA